ncbi:Aldehyde/histidinol dehydrogenase [Trichoderma camerunense]
MVTLSSVTSPLKKAIPYQFKDPSLIDTRSLIGGKWTDALSGKTFKLYDPDDNAEICDIADLDAEDTHRAIDAASKAFETYQHTPHRERRWLMRRWGDLIKANREDLAALCTLELGKPYTDSLGTVQYAVDFVDWFEGAIERTIGETIPASRTNSRMLTIRQPQGVVAAITPWNSPVAMITRKVGAAIAAGNTVVCKPAPETPLCAIALAKLFERAGGPPGVFNVVTSGYETTPRVGFVLSTHVAVKHLSFTGSTAVGRLLNTQCAQTIKKTSLELGGNASFIIFDDADIDKAVEGLITSKFRSSGQTCVCANRVYVHSSIMDVFADALAEGLKSTFHYGSVWDKKTNFGPLYHSKGIIKVKEHLQDALSKGAQLHYGGEDPSHGPNFFPATVIKGAKEGMSFMTEETFGPLAFLIPFETEEEVIRLANHSVNGEAPVGLASYFYTENASRIWRISEALKVGMVGARVGLVSAAEGPFGGVFQSGLGREGGIAALNEFLDIKSIVIGI